MDQSPIKDLKVFRELDIKRSFSRGAKSLSTHYKVEAFRNGELLWVEEFDNLVVDVGLNDSLDKHLKGSDYTAKWFVGLASQDPLFDHEDTMDEGHPGWTEKTNYSEEERPEAVFGSVENLSVDNSASKAVFSISSNVTIGGAFLNSTKNKGGSTGILYGGGAFTQNRVLEENDTLNVVLTCSADAYSPESQSDRGNSIWTNNYAFPPDDPKIGDVWMPKDTLYTFVHDGIYWVAYYEGKIMTLPVPEDFAWVNQETATLDSSKGYMYVLAPKQAGSDLRILKMSAPSVPYIVTAWMIPNFLNQSYCTIGLAFRKTDGKLHTLNIAVNVLSSTKFDSPTAWAGHYSQLTFFFGFGQPICLRIEDDGTNRLCSVSSDGTNFILVHSVERTHFLGGAADEIGFYVDSNNADFDAGATLLSWKIT